MFVCLCVCVVCVCVCVCVREMEWAIARNAGPCAPNLLWSPLKITFGGGHRKM